MIKCTMNNESIQWFKALKEYYYREQYELFDLSKDPHETKNVANDPEYKSVFDDLKSKLYNWHGIMLQMTHGYVGHKGYYWESTCNPLLNDL